MTAMRSMRLLVLVVAVAGIATLIGCPPASTGNNSGGGDPAVERPDLGAPDESLEGTVDIDGSSTVFPIQDVVAELFDEKYPNVKVSVGFSGTGGGMKKFTSTDEADRTDISDASRPIKDSEAANFRANIGAEFVEIPLAYDGLTVVIHPGNTFVDHLTSEELQLIFKADGAMTWKDVRSDWPAEEIKCYAPGQASGTFDYFNEAIMQKGKVAFRPPTACTFSEDDNVLVAGVAGDNYAIGFFGFAFYIHNTDKVKSVAIKDSKDDSHAPTSPTYETIGNATYRPLSRPIFMYVSLKAYERPEVKKYVEFALTDAVWDYAVWKGGYIILPNEIKDAVRARLANKTTGSEYANGKHGALTDLFVK